MAINIVDQFQVNTYLPIDNRFVVGTASMSTTSGTYSPFYLYRDDILYKYPGLRIWDFNDGVPYVWTGSTWSNENTTGALVQNGGGHQNWIPKFINNSTLLGKSLMFDNGVNIGLGISTAPSFPTGATGGIHIQGWVRTNTGFVGNGTNLTTLNASNITLGILNIARIATPIPYIVDANYVLTSINGTNYWQDINAISPVIQGLNLPGGSGIFSQLNNNQYEFRSLTSTGFDITQSTNNINLESKPGDNTGDLSGTEIYSFNTTTKRHEFRRIRSNTLKISLEDYPNNNDTLSIELPQSGSSAGIYVNCSYIPTYDDWKRAYDLQQSAAPGRYLDSNGYYRGDGSSARPFTNSIAYTLNQPNITPTILPNTSIKNALDFYINEFGTTTNTASNAIKAGNTIVIENPGEYDSLGNYIGSTYTFSGNFSINYLRLRIMSGTYILCTTNGYLIDMDDVSIFNTNNAYVELRVEEGSVLELRGLGTGNYPFVLSYSNACKGFRNSGNVTITSSYSSAKSIYLLGKGYIKSYFKPLTPIVDNLYIFNGGFTTTPSDYNNTNNDATRILQNNNDGNLCFIIECNVYARNQGIINISGNSKIEFRNCEVTSGDLGHTDFTTSFNNQDNFLMSGGLIRFFGVKFFISGGVRKNAFTFRPNTLFVNITDTNYSAPYYGGSKPELRVRDSQFSGTSINLFNKISVGVSICDVSNCSSIYFGCTEIFETYTNPSLTAPTTSNPPSDNWLGWGSSNTNIIDNRWGKQYDPKLTYPNITGATSSYYNGLVSFTGNILENGNINQNKVDLTNSNVYSQSNIIQGSQLTIYPYNLSYFGANGGAINGNYWKRARGTYFLYASTLLSAGGALVQGNLYYVENPGNLSNPTVRNQWNTTGITYSAGVTPGGNPAVSIGKIFMCSTASVVPTGTASVRLVELKYIP